MNAYCLFVETGREALLKAGLQDILPDSVVLVPSYTYHLYTGSSQWIDQRRNLLNGYIFLYLPYQLDVSVVWEARPLGIIRFLRNNANGTYELEGSDKAFAELMVITVFRCQTMLTPMSVLKW